MSNKELTPDVEKSSSSPKDDNDDGLAALGYTSELHRNRSMFTLLFQTIAIAAVPYGEGAALLQAILDGGPLAIFVGWIVVCVLDQCVALSLGELASRYPTSAGPYYWSFQIAKRNKETLSFVTGWIWLIGNWTITLSVNFGFAELIAATVSLYHPNWAANDWQLLLIFYAICLITFAICALGNRLLPLVDTICAAWTTVTILVVLISLAATAKLGRHSADYALGYYDTSLSGWSNFTFFIGLLPAAYVFSAIGMVASMAEEVQDPSVKVPKAISLCIPIAGTSGLFFILPVCFTLPALKDLLNAPSGQAIPYIFHVVTGSPGGGLGLTFLVLGVTLFCSLSITNAASRCTWAFARDNAIPGSRLFSKVDAKLGVPLWALALLTVVQILLGLIDLGSTSAFQAFISVGVMALALGYMIPIAISLFSNRREEVSKARWNCGRVVGPVVNVLAIAWIAFEMVLFSMPDALPVTAVSMNYASVVLVAFMLIALCWYLIHARKVYKGPPASDGL